MPDIATTAKGIGGGLPLGCVMFSEKTENVLVAGDHATTFGGNPVATAGAEYILKTMDETFLAEVTAKGEYMRKKILSMPHVVGIDGLGLMMGIRLDDTIISSDVVKKGIDKGVLLLTAKTKVRLLPPLNITYNEIDRGLKALEEALSE
jgi:acetylornithine/N-succinyldiaminopimelate aminotransferase